jgi:hypothetical protein
MVTQISDSHSAFLGEIRAFTVAACPKDCEQVARGDGIGDLLLFWLEEAPAPSVQTIQSRASMPRMIDRFGHHEEIGR